MAHPVTHPAQRLDQDVTAGPEVPARAVFAIGDLGVARQMLFIAVVADKPDARDEAGNDADGERAAAEAEAENLVAGLVVAAAERIDIDDVALQPEAENAAEDGQRLER